MMERTILKFNWIYIVLLVASAIRLLQGERRNKADSSWYKGCYTLPFNGTVHKQPLRERMRTWSPAKCAMKCVNSRYAFAYLPSRTSCFCLGALTRKIHDSFCNLKCGTASSYSCGGSRSASVYSANGPYIAKYDVKAEPLIVEKDEDISITINIELGHDTSMKSGIPGVDGESFGRVEIHILEDPDIRPTRIKRVLHIVGTKGKAQINIHYLTEGRKVLDVTMMNPISTVYERLYIDVESRMPDKPQLWMESPALFSVCNPRTTDEMVTLQNVHNTVFIGESVMIWAKVWSGYNLTFQWNFCGEVERVFEFATQSPSCQLTLCKENIQEFTFNKTMECEIEVVVSNSFGSTKSSMIVSAISPKFKDLEVEALPYKWEWEMQKPSRIPMYDPLIPWSLNIQEGETGERGSESRRYGIAPVYEVFTSPNPMEPPKAPDNHIPLQIDQYLLEKRINFKAIFFMNKIGLSTYMEINFGDGDILLHNVEPTGYGRKKRQIEERGYEWSHRAKTPRFLEYINKTFDENDDGASSSNNQKPRSGIETEHGLDCILEAKFWHIYSIPGIYSVSLRVFDEDISISGGIEEPIHVLNGTAELNIRCPKVAELGKSVIFSLSSVSNHQGKWIWRISRNSSTQWTPDERLAQSTFSLKRSFLRRGFYRIEVSSENGKLSSGCIILVEEALSGLSVASEKTIVQTGNQIVLHIRLESGSDVGLEVFSEEKLIKAQMQHIENSKWTATFIIYKANCYKITVRATNPISLLTSDFVSVCVEESIAGLQLRVPDQVNLNKPIPGIVSISSGSNVSIGVSVTTLSGVKVAYLEKNIMAADEKASIKLSPIVKSGIYRVIARAKNNVFAKSSSCDVLDYIEVEKRITASSHIPWSPNLVLNRWKLSRVAQDQRNNKMGVYIYVAKLKENRHGALVGDGILYIWSLKQRTVQNGRSVYKVTYYYTSSPLFMLSLGKCALTHDLLNSVSKTSYVARPGEDSSNRCDVGVTLKTLTGFHAEFNSVAKDISRLLIIPQSGVIEVGSSCEFDIKCPMSTSGKCSVDFGDGSQPMTVTSNSNMKSLSHAFTETGLHRITLSEHGWGFVTKQIYMTQVLVQERIMSLNLQGTTSLSIGIGPVGAWRVSSLTGTNKVYKWSIHHINGSETAVKFSREEEYAHSFVDIGKYIVEVAVYNDISHQVAQMAVVVEDTYWFFNVKTNTSVLGQPSLFIISTNATNNVVVAKFQNSSEIVQFELSCLPSVGHYLDENDATIHQYIISHTYNETGIYEASFSLLLQTQEISYQSLYTVETEVRHKPEPKYLKIEIISDEAVKIGGRNYVPTNKEITIESSTNYDPAIFSWKIWKNGSLDEKPFLDIAVSANHGTSKVHYKFEEAGLYKVHAVSHPEEGDGNKAAIEIEAEEVITRVWVDKPFSSGLGEVVDRCTLKEHVRNGPLEYECDSLTLSASSFGTQVTFYFYIYFRDDVPGDYSAPTEVIDIVKVTSKSTATNKASVEYRFNRQGVYSIMVVASNHLGNKSAEVPFEIQADGTLRPFLFYAQRLIQKISFKEDYHAVFNRLSTFEVNVGNNTQFLDLEWDMGDGTELTGKSVQHTYNTIGRKTVIVVATNRVDKQMMSTTVSVEIPITSVKLDEMPRTRSSLTKVRLTALVRPPKAAVLFTWYIGNQSSVVPYFNYIDYKFTGGGIYSVKVVASNNVSSVESQPISVEVQEDILGYFVGENVVQTNRSTLLEIQFTHGSNISIQWRIDDLELQHDNFTLSYTFTKVGVYYVHVNLTNKLGSSSITRKIFVVDTLCQVPKSTIIDNKNHVIMVTRSNPIQLEVNVELNCSYMPRVLYEWKVWKIQFDSDSYRETVGKELFDIADTPSDGKVLRIPPQVLNYGNYSITVNVTIEGTVLYHDADIRVDIYPSRPVAKIDGGKIQYLQKDDEILLDASVSYDPDYPNESGNLKYDWECFVLFAQYTPCFEEEYLEGTDLFLPTVVPTTVNANSNMRAMDTYSFERDASHKRIPVSVPKNRSSISFPGSWLIADRQRFVFRVKVTANAIGWGPRLSEETVIIKLPSRKLEWIQIECKNCGDNKIVNQVPLVFHATCASCVNSLDEEDVKLEWSMYEVLDGSSTYYKNETSHCAPTNGEGWLSLKGPSGNESDFNMSMADPLEGLLPVMNTSFWQYEENSDFIGETISEEELRKPVSVLSHSRDNAPFPADPTHPMPTATTRHHIMSDLGQVSWQPSLPDDDKKDIGLNLVEGTSKNSRNSVGEDRRKTPPPTQSPRPGYFVASPRADHYRVDDVADNDLQSNTHYQDYDNIVVNLMKIAKSGVDNPTLVLHPNTLIGGKTYFVKISIHNKDNDETLIGKASYYFSVLRGPSYGMCGVLYRLNNYAVHCVDWRNQQNDNRDDIVSRYQMSHYDVKYSLQKSGHRRHIYCGIKNDVSFNLPYFDKPAYIHIAVLNADGARTEVCSFLPEGPHTHVNATDDDYFEDAYNKSVVSGSKLNELISIGDSKGIIALSNIILDTLPNDDFFEKNNQKIEDAEKVIFSVISALSLVKPQNILEVEYIVDAVSRGLSRRKLVGIKSYFKASKLIVRSADYIKAMKSAKHSSWQMNALEDEQIVDMFVNARLHLTEACQGFLSQFRKTNYRASNPSLTFDTERKKSTSETIHLGDVFKREKDTDVAMNSFFLSLVESRPVVVGRLSAKADGYQYVAQHLDKIVKHGNDKETREESLMLWNVGAVIPDAVEKQLTEQNNGKVYAIASTLPDISISDFKTNNIDDRRLSLTLHKGDFAELKLSKLIEPITISLPPRYDKLIEPIHGLISRDHVTVNTFAASRQHNRTLHIEVTVTPMGNRSFPVTIAITKQKKSLETAPNDGDIITKIVLTRGLLSAQDNLGGGVSSKFTMRDSDFIEGHHSYQIALWNEQFSTGRSRRFDDRHIPYTVKMWWSDCYYWNELISDWRQDGVKSLDESTSLQTLCSTSHLSTFSASFIPVRFGASEGNNQISIHRTGFFAAFAILVLFFLAMVFYVRVTHGYKCRESFVEVSRLFQPKFNAVGRRLRWYFGPDQKSGVVPIVLHDNKKEHEQVFELLIQTSCWPGSGTTSNVTMRIYGEEGKYEARELITPKTHSAREARFENGFAEDDDCSGINDELFITGALTKFVITFPKSKGNIKKIALWHDHSGETPDWRVDYITIRDVMLDQKYHFACYDWVAIGKGKESNVCEMMPLHEKPALHQQIALKLNASLCNFSSICGIVASPGYGNLTRPQRAVHLMSLIVIICGLSAARFWMEWDIFGNDTELPYVSNINVWYGFAIGIIAAILCLPAQLIFRFSKQDDKISLTIEDATDSISGSGFLGDYYPMHHASSVNVAKSIEKPDQSHRVEEINPHGTDVTVLSSMECDYCLDDSCNIPGIKEAVCDWLDSKDDSEREDDAIGSSKTIDKDWNLPMDQSLSQCKLKQSTSSIDEEIAKCMMSQSPLKRTHHIVEKDSNNQRIDHFDDTQFEEDGQKFPAPIQGSNEIFTVSARLKKELDSMLQSGSLLAEQYAQMEGIYSSFGTNLEIIAPEIVPCEKLEPIPRDFGTLLPKKCRKVAWIYSASNIFFAVVFTLWGSAYMSSYDVIPWIETVLFSIVGLLVVFEGSLIFLFAVFKSFFDTAKWKMTWDDFGNLMDNILCVSHFSTMTKNSTDFYIDSSTYYPLQDCGHSQGTDRLVDDARVARQIADRERSRYLRHVQPVKISKTSKQKARKAHKLDTITKQWVYTLFLLVNGLITAAILSHRYDDIIMESSATKSWLKETSIFPTKQKPISIDAFQHRNLSEYVLHNAKTRHDWVKWFSDIVCLEEDVSDLQRDKAMKPLDLLLKEDLQNKKNFKALHQKSDDAIQYLLVGNARLTVKLCQSKCYREFLPQDIKTIINYQKYPPRAAGIDEIEAFLKGDFNQTNDIEFESTSHTIKFFSDGLVQGKEVLTELLRKDAVFSANFEAVLYNPSSNLYSHISSSVEMLNGEETSMSTPFITTNVRSVMFTYSPNHYSKISYDMFFVCEVCLMSWVGFYAFKCILGMIRWILTKVGNGDNKKNHQSNNNVLEIVTHILDVLVFILCVTFFALSGQRQTLLGGIIPVLYGYETETIQNKMAFPFEDLVANTTMLSSVCGLLNFLMLLKVVAILKRYHNFPAFKHLSTNWKTAMGEILLLFLIFWTLVIIISFCTYIAFLGEYDFSSFAKSIMSIILQCVTLGAAPVKVNLKFSMIRAKYGTFVTFFFFFVIFVTFRLLLKAFFLAMLRQKQFDTEKKQKEVKHITENAISAMDLLIYLWENLRYGGYCLLSVFPCLNKGTFASHYPDFSSLGFKSTSVSRRERIKLGLTSSEYDRKPLPCDDAKKPKKNAGEIEKSKYRIPSKVLLSEVDSQLDEMYDRASALADANNEEELVTDQDLEQSHCESADVTQPSAFSISEQHDPNMSQHWRDNVKIIPVGCSLDSAISVKARRQKGKRRRLESQDKSRSASSISVNQKSSYYRDKIDSGISCGSRNSTPGFSRFDKKPCVQKENPTHKPPPGNDRLKKLFAAKSTKSSMQDIHTVMLPERRYGWISDDDILDRSSVVSAISHSSFGRSSTPVPALTALNLERHNHDILSRQASSATRSGRSSEKMVQISELPSESSDIVHEDIPTLPETFTQKLWKQLSSIKNHFKAQPQSEAQSHQARPLRRSRTIAINIRDIPKVNTKQLKTTATRRDRQPRATSNASTTKLQSLVNSTRQALDPNYVRTIQLSQDDGLQYPVRQEHFLYHRNLAFDGPDELDIISIPGAVPPHEISRSSITTTCKDVGTSGVNLRHGGERSEPIIGSSGMVVDGCIEDGN